MAEKATGILHPEVKPEVFAVVVADQRGGELVFCWLLVVGLVVSSVIFLMIAGPVAMAVYFPAASNLPESSLSKLEGWIPAVGMVVGGFGTAIVGSYQCVSHLTRALLVHRLDFLFARQIYQAAPCTKKTSVADKAVGLFQSIG